MLKFYLNFSYRISLVKQLKKDIEHVDDEIHSTIQQKKNVNGKVHSSHLMINTENTTEHYKRTYLIFLSF